MSGGIGNSTVLLRVLILCVMEAELLGKHGSLQCAWHLSAVERCTHCGCTAGSGLMALQYVFVS